MTRTRTIRIVISKSGEGQEACKQSGKDWVMFGLTIPDIVAEFDKFKYNLQQLEGFDTTSLIIELEICQKSAKGRGPFTSRHIEALFKNKMSDTMFSLEECNLFNDAC